MKDLLVNNTIIEQHESQGTDFHNINACYDWRFSANVCLLLV